MKIAGNTPISDLAFRRAQLGIIRYTVEIDSDHRMIHRVRVVAHTADFVSYGTGATESEAFDDVFHRIWHRVAQVVAETPSLIEIERVARTG